MQYSFSPNKKWAISPLISPCLPEVHSSGLDKLVCIFRIRRFPEEFNREILVGKLNPPILCDLEEWIPGDLPREPVWIGKVP